MSLLGMPAACSANDPRGHHVDAKPPIASTPGSSASSRESAAPGPRRSSLTRGTGVDDRTRNAPKDGFYEKYQQSCANMPYPGPLIRAYRVHECWLASWHKPPYGSVSVMYLFGREPGRAARQVLMAGIVNRALHVAPLPRGLGLAHMVSFGRTCAVIGYDHSHTKSYYRPAQHRLVSFCRWRR
jgi:hypothetical protein